MAKKPEPKVARIVYAERMLSIADMLTHDAMTGDDIKRAFDCIITAYQETAPELPALAGYAIKRIEGLSLTLAHVQAETKALEKHIQKWKGV